MSDLDRKPTSDERIEALLRSTGRRPAVPAERTARVRMAVRAEWQAEVRRRSRRRRFAWVAVLATAATGLAAVGLGLWKGARPAPVSRIAAIVEAAPSTSGAAAWRPGDEIEVGAELATADGARLAIRMGSGHSVRLAAGTRVSLLSDRALALDHGLLYVDSAGPAGRAGGPVDVRTRLGALRDVGTQFEARLFDDGLRVRVREGRVLLEREGGRREIVAGQELQLSADGRAALRDAPGFGPDWLWLAEVTPMLSIEGRPVAEFLDWMARERGLRLEYSSADLATSASEILLNGSIDGMTLDEALASVLPACRMRHRIERDRLRIEPLEGPARP